MVRSGHINVRRGDPSGRPRAGASPAPTMEDKRQSVHDPVETPIVLSHDAFDTLGQSFEVAMVSKQC